MKPPAGFLRANVSEGPFRVRLIPSTDNCKAKRLSVSRAAVIGALRDSISMTETLKLIQFRAAYNLPVHAGIETGIFARHELALETAYTPGSNANLAAIDDGSTNS